MHYSTQAYRDSLAAFPMFFPPQNHEFTDELTYSEVCMTESVGFRTSRSTSLSSHQGGSSSCCPRRAKRRAIRLANSTVSVSRGSMQELDTLHVQKTAPTAPQRYSRLCTLHTTCCKNPAWFTLT